MKRSRYQFNLALNEEHHDIVTKLKNHYGINVSGVFKIFLKQYLEQLEKKHVNPNLQIKT